MPRGLNGARIVCLESRRAKEMATLVEKQGGTAISAPSMREVPLGEQRPAIDFADTLSANQCDVLLLLTGVGANMLFDALRTRLDEATLQSCLLRTNIYCRGPKPLAVLKKLSVAPRGVAPEPNTWRELVALLKANENLEGARVFVQEYGRTTPELLAQLRAMGARVESIPVYAWSLPEDTEPLRNAVRRIVLGDADAVLFTSAQQLDHLLQIATLLDHREELLSRLRRDLVVASIGPVTSEALTELGVPVDTVPVHPKMGQLVSHLAENWATLRTKRIEPGLQPSQDPPPR